MVAIAGCTTIFEDEGQPIAVDQAQLERIGAIEWVDPPADVPNGVADDHVAAWIDRTNSLLEGIPPSLEDVIPNEAVRQYITDSRNSAQERLAAVDSEMPNFAQLSDLRSARNAAAKADGAYAAANGNRDRDDVFSRADETAATLTALETDLTRAGVDVSEVVVRSAAIERRLAMAKTSLERIEHVSPLESTVTVVGEGTSRIESARARLETARHLLERQAEIDDTEAFDDEFKALAPTLLDTVTEAVPDIRSESEAGTELFEGPIEETPRETIARSIAQALTLQQDRATNRLDDGRYAQALLDVYGLYHDRRTLDRLVAVIEEGKYGRPANGQAVREHKEAAIAAAESVRDDTNQPYLVHRRLQRVLASIHDGDWQIEDGGYDAERTTVEAMAHYGLAIERAKTLPAATDWFVSAIS